MFICFRLFLCIDCWRRLSYLFLTFTASSFTIWNNSAGIPSPPLALFVVTLPKAHLTLHSKMSGSRWVITPSWLSSSYQGSLSFSSSLCWLGSQTYCWIYMMVIDLFHLVSPGGKLLVLISPLSIIFLSF